ncbi:MAG: putative toxin-antitoxin system toxin component, PIN family [Sedimenticola sp.]
MIKVVVVDTSILISALIGSRGPSREILRKCLLGDYIPLISNTLFSEYEAVSKRKQIRNLCPLTNDEITKLLNAFYGVCHWVPIYYLWRPNLVDEGDDFLIELALAGNATHIITNNIGDLKNAELKFPSLTIAKPEELLRGI